MGSDFVIMGLPASGKTTFLAALWHLIESGETDCRLQLKQYEGDLTYLNQIAEAWRSFRAVPRTSQVGDIDVTIHLIDRETSVEAAAFFPDLAGESFDAQVEARQCRPGFVEAINTDDGILFFIGADLKWDQLSVVDLNSMIPAHEGPEAAPSARPPEIPDSAGSPNEVASPTEGMPGHVADVAEAIHSNLANVDQASLSSVDQATAPVLKEWEPKLIPEQVRIVQLLSDLLGAPFEPRPRRLAILISAWDLTRGTGLGPQEWLAQNLPMVDQFLRANEAQLDHRIYGVSAQGVRLDDAGAVDEAAKLTPSRRIEIHGPQGSSNDLTLPLVWLMSTR